MHCNIFRNLVIEFGAFEDKGEEEQLSKGILNGLLTPYSIKFIVPIYVLD